LNQEQKILDPFLDIIKYNPIQEEKAGYSENSEVSKRRSENLKEIFGCP
jgi:hypothetical protein